MNSFIFSVLFLCGLSAFGQSFKADFQKFAKAQDTASMRVLVEKWESQSPTDVEMCVANANYYLLKAKQSVISLGTERKNGEVNLELTPADGSSSEPTAFLSGSTVYDPVNTQKSIFYLDKALEMHPDRLDIRFGKVYVLGELKRYGDFSQDIIEAVEYGHSIKHNWKWANGEPLNKAKEFMLSTIQSYVNQLFNQTDPVCLDYVINISVEVLKQFPTEVIFLSNIGAVHVLREEYSKALPYFQRATKADPSDAIVLTNLGFTYLQLEDIKMARKYYKLAMEHGDPETRENAANILEELKN